MAIDHEARKRNDEVEMRTAVWFDMLVMTLRRFGQPRSLLLAGALLAAYGIGQLAIVSGQ